MENPASWPMPVKIIDEAIHEHETNLAAPSPRFGFSLPMAIYTHLLSKGFQIIPPPMPAPLSDEDELEPADVQTCKECFTPYVNVYADKPEFQYGVEGFCSEHCKAYFETNLTPGAE